MIYFMSVTVKHSTYLFNLFNKTHSEIEFTIKHEQNEKSQFLDLGTILTPAGQLQRHI